MGKKAVEHIENHHELVKHHRKHKKLAKHHPSRFSLFKHRIADVFKEIVEAPEQEKAELVHDFQELPQSMPEDEKIAPIEKEEVSPVKVEEKVEEVEEEDLLKQERDRRRDAVHEEILQNLNKAVSDWKQSGDVGLHLQAPVSLREKVRKFLSKMKRHPADVSTKVEEHAEEVAEKVASRIKEAEETGKQVDAEEIIGEEWKSVVHKMEEVSRKPSEREEIEKIYKELSEK